MFPLFLSASFLFFEKKDKRRKILFCFIFILTIWALTITLSRGAWLAVFGGACVLVFLSKWKFLPITALSLVLVFLLFFSFSSNETKQKMRIDPAEFSGTVGWRKDLWVD
ncbi:MAG: O-antigen ligase family protein, partial [Candidatus Omnitrophica bacterium]|nr:O-antigen ligase family protein [Candidatus Omnitrophota bacterium]